MLSTQLRCSLCRLQYHRMVDSGNSPITSLTDGGLEEGAGYRDPSPRGVQQAKPSQGETLSMSGHRCLPASCAGTASCRAAAAGLTADGVVRRRGDLTVLALQNWMCDRQGACLSASARGCEAAAVGLGMEAAGEESAGNIASLSRLQVPAFSSGIIICTGQLPSRHGKVCN